MAEKDIASLYERRRICQSKASEREVYVDMEE
jgi:hypothetical protein